MKVHIRRYLKTDEESIKKLIKLNNEEEDKNYLLSNAKAGNSFVAVVNQEIVGFALTWNSNYHRFCNYFRMIIDPYFEGMNVANELFKAINEASNNDLPFQTSLWETNIGLTQFYEQNKFRLIRKTYLPELVISNIDDWLRSKQPTALHNSIMLDDIKGDSRMMSELINLVKRNYEQTHMDNPIAELDLREWEKLIFAEDTIKDGSFVLLDEKEQVVAYSLLHASDHQNGLELGWCGSVHSKWKKAIPQLVIEQIKYASKHGYELLLGEFDTSSPFAMEVIATIPFPPCGAWVTYQKNKDHSL